MDNKLRIYLYPLITVTIWGITFAAAKIAVSATTPTMVMAFRFVLGALFFGIYGALCGELRLPTKREALVLALLGFMGFYFHIGLQTLAMKTAGSATANLQMAASPAAAALLAAFFLKERVTPKAVVGIIISFIGVAVTLLMGTKGAEGISSYTWGDFLISITAFNWAAYMVLTRSILRGDNYKPIFTLFWELFFCSIFVIPTLWILNEDVSVVFSFSAATWCAVLFLAFFATFLAYVFWFRATAKLTIAQIMAFQFIQPIVGIVAGYFLVGERFTIWLAVGAAMIVAGVYAVNTSKKN